MTLHHDASLRKLLAALPSTDACLMNLTGGGVLLSLNSVTEFRGCVRVPFPLKHYSIADCKLNSKMFREIDSRSLCNLSARTSFDEDDTCSDFKSLNLSSARVAFCNVIFISFGILAWRSSWC